MRIDQPDTLFEMELMGHEEAGELVADGCQLTEASLHEPDQAPAGTRFIMVQFPSGRMQPYRVWLASEEQQ